ncbi:MAG: hypothetical protein AAF790_09445 [Planctomycetota bacterium]
MDDFCEDPLTGRRVLYAEHRAGRPNEFAAAAGAAGADASPRADCVFCPGNEAATPETRLQVPKGGAPWRVRVVPNKYPAVDAQSGGVHEVIIESRRHVQRTGQLTTDELAEVLLVYADRLRAVADAGRPYRLIFKNVGPSAGASLSHLHSQVIGLPEAPPLAALEASNYAALRGEAGRCPWLGRLMAERADGRRVVHDGDGYFAFCPAASRQPYELTVLPAPARAEEALPIALEASIKSPAAANRLARVLMPLLRAVEGEIGQAGYNVLLHTAPILPSGVVWPWRIEIVPRVTSLAGLELATGLFLNVVSPERAAETLRARIAAAGHASA